MMNIEPSINKRNASDILSSGRIEEHAKIWKQTSKRTCDVVVFFLMVEYHSFQFLLQFNKNIALFFLPNVCTLYNDLFHVIRIKSICEIVSIIYQIFLLDTPFFCCCVVFTCMILDTFDGSNDYYYFWWFRSSGL